MGDFPKCGHIINTCCDMANFKYCQLCVMIIVESVTFQIPARCHWFLLCLVLVMLSITHDYLIFFWISIKNQFVLKHCKISQVAAFILCYSDKYNLQTPMGDTAEVRSSFSLMSFLRIVKYLPLPPIWCHDVLRFPLELHWWINPIHSDGG